MAKRSKLLRDQPEKPIDRAVWWIEYMLRNPDSSHLRTPTIELGFVRANSLDLYAILVSFVFLVSFIIFHSVMKLCTLGRGGDKKVKRN